MIKGFEALCIDKAHLIFELFDRGDLAPQCDGASFNQFSKLMRMDAKIIDGEKYKQFNIND